MSSPDSTLVDELNRLANGGATYRRADLMVGHAAAANAWAGTSGLSMIGALNAKAGTFGVGLNAVCNQLAATSGLSAVAALRQKAS